MVSNLANKYVAAVLMSACFSGCATVSAEAQKVKIIDIGSEQPADLDEKTRELRSQKCELKGEVDAGAPLKDTTRGMLKSRASELGGNTIITSGIFHSMRLSGTVFLCPTVNLE